VPARERGSLDWESYAFSFGRRLVILRKARGFSQEELAHRSGMHRNAVSNLERGTSNRDPYLSDPQLSTVYRLAHALNIPAVYLMPDASVVPPHESTENVSTRAISRVEHDLHLLLNKGKPPADD